MEIIVSSLLFDDNVSVNMPFQLLLAAAVVDAFLLLLLLSLI